MNPIKGSCLCGRVEFKVSGELRKVIFCHCTQCIKTHGHYSAYTAIGKEDLILVSSETLNWYRSSSKARRGFCRECGSSLFFEPTNGNSVSIAAGAVTYSAELVPQQHIYFDSKPDYYEISDNLPKK